jgi:hypothetical protein
MDHNYKTTGNRIGQTVDKVSGDDMNHSQIERVRARDSWVLLGAYIRALADYGWALQRHAHQNTPLTLQFAGCSLRLLPTNAQCFAGGYLIFPGSPGTTAASGNILWMSGGSLYG